MSDARDQLETLIAAIKAPPKEVPVSLYFYRRTPPERKGSCGTIRNIDRNTDPDELEEMIRTFLIEERRQRGGGNYLVNIIVPRSTAEAKKGVYGKPVYLDFALPEPDPAPPPPAPPPPAVEAPRAPNPVAADPMDEIRHSLNRARDLRGMLDELGELTERECRGCGEPESECVCRCDDPPAGCGLPISECPTGGRCASQKPSGIGAMLEEVFVNEQGKKLMQGVAEEGLNALRGFNRRFFGASGSKATVVDTAKTAAKVVTRVKPGGT